MKIGKRIGTTMTGMSNTKLHIVKQMMQDIDKSFKITGHGKRNGKQYVSTSVPTIKSKEIKELHKQGWETTEVAYEGMRKMAYLRKFVE